MDLAEKLEILDSAKYDVAWHLQRRGACWKSTAAWAAAHRRASAMPLPRTAAAFRC